MHVPVYSTSDLSTKKTASCILKHAYDFHVPSLLN